MASLTFSFLLFASYCLALVFVLPPAKQAGQHGWRFDQALRTSWPVVGLTVVLFNFSDVVIDPVALQGGTMIFGENLRISTGGCVFWCSPREFWGIGRGRIPHAPGLPLVGTRLLCVRPHSPGSGEMGVAPGYWPLLRCSGPQLGRDFLDW